MPCRDVEFVFVGGLEGASGGGCRPDWEAERAAALALPNVRRVGPVRQEDVPKHYWGFGVNWIPYATDHAFNQAACPTKIMDGLASGRPVLSTDSPECRLYPGVDHPDLHGGGDGGADQKFACRPGRRGACGAASGFLARTHLEKTRRASRKLAAGKVMFPGTRPGISWQIDPAEKGIFIRIVPGVGRSSANGGVLLDRVARGLCNRAAVGLPITLPPGAFCPFVTRTHGFAADP